MEELLLHMIISGKYSQWKFQMVTDIKVSRFFMIGIVWSSPLIYERFVFFGWHILVSLAIP